jgi:hypothetical protein
MRSPANTRTARRARRHGFVRRVFAPSSALKAFADFDAKPAEPEDLGEAAEIEDAGDGGAELLSGLNLGYTINLHLPPTSDVAVFNAIFKSLREHLLR